MLCNNADVLMWERRLLMIELRLPVDDYETDDSTASSYFEEEKCWEGSFEHDIKWYII